MKCNNAHLLIVILAIALFALSETHAQKTSDPEENFEYLWKEFDERYGIFLPKRVDWDLLYEVYRPKVTPSTTDDELFEIMSSMLGHLNDLHVRLDSKNPTRSFRSGGSQEDLIERFGSFDNFLDFYRSRPINKKYIKGELHERHNNIFAYAWLKDDIGYFHFNKFNDVEESSSAIDEIVDYFKDAKALIIDVRRNGGGDDKVGKAIADRFADKERLYMITQMRNGPRHDDFDKPQYWYVEPDGPDQFTKPIILIINEFSGSAAENFALAIRVLPHATLVGDFTAGCFADSKALILPNGWYFSVSINLFVDYNGFCWEGIGVPPDLRIINTDEDVGNGRDRVLEFAVDLINSGALKSVEKKRDYPIE
jgi:C-terminal processing protease CtpA/Prc